MSDTGVLPDEISIPRSYKNRRYPEKHRAQVAAANRARARARKLLIELHRAEYDALYATEAALEGVQPTGRLEFPRGHLVNNLTAEELVARRKQQIRASYHRPLVAMRRRRVTALRRLAEAVETIAAVDPTGPLGKRNQNRLVATMRTFLDADAALRETQPLTPDDQVEALLQQVRAG